MTAKATMKFTGDGRHEIIEVIAEDPLDEPIPDFNQSEGCDICGGRGIIENADGDKEPCTECPT